MFGSQLHIPYVLLGSKVIRVFQIQVTYIVAKPQPTKPGLPFLSYLTEEELTHFREV